MAQSIANWPLFSVLLAMGLFGAVAVLPYGFSISQEQVENSPLSRTLMIALTLAQSAILLAVTAGIGLLAAQAVGLDLPILCALLNGEPVGPMLAATAPLAVISGGLAGVLVLALEIGVFRPRMPAAIKSATQNATAWQGFLASFYGGINEEIMLRLFAFSGCVWLLSRFTGGIATDASFWFASIVAALLFGIGHLPATARLAPLSVLLVVRALVLNGFLGVIAAILFWRCGLEAAMIAHFSADTVLHVLAGLVMKNQKIAGFASQSANDY